MLPANKATLACRGSYGHRAIPLIGSPTISRLSLCNRNKKKDKPTGRYTKKGWMTDRRILTVKLAHRGLKAFVPHTNSPPSCLSKTLMKLRHSPCRKNKQTKQKEIIITEGRGVNLQGTQGDKEGFEQSRYKTVSVKYEECSLKTALRENNTLNPTPSGRTTGWALYSSLQSGGC